MNSSTKSDPPNKSNISPLVFLLLMGIMVVSTLVVASEYFLRPQIEAALKKEAHQHVKNVEKSKTRTQVYGVLQQFENQQTD